jgi:hypothetical protein
MSFDYICHARRNLLPPLRFLLSPVAIVVEPRRSSHILFRRHPAVQALLARSMRAGEADFVDLWRDGVPVAESTPRAACTAAAEWEAAGRAVFGEAGRCVGVRVVEERGW